MRPQCVTVSSIWWCVTLQVMWPVAVQAESLAADIRSYDIESLMWAVVMALMGGALRTIFTLATDATVVLSFGREILKDAVVAMIAGVLAFIVLQAANSFTFASVPSEVRFAVIVFAGWSRLSFFGWLNRLGTRASEAVEDRMVAAIGEARLRSPIDVEPEPPKARPFNEV